MALRIVGIVAHPLFDSWPRRGKVALGRFDVAAGEGGAALVKCLRGVSGLGKSSNGDRSKSFPRWHNPAPAWPGPSAPKPLIHRDQGWQECFAEFFCRRRDCRFETLRGKQGRSWHRRIRRDFQRAIVTGSSGRPVTHIKVIVGRRNKRCRALRGSRDRARSKLATASRQRPCRR